MNGMTILHIIPAYDGMVAFYIALGIAVINLGLLIAAIAAEWDEDLAVIFGISLLISAFVVVCCGFSTHAQRYEVALSEEADMQEFLERYTIVEQRGMIYTIEEKA